MPTTKREIHHLVYLHLFERDPFMCAPTYEIAAHVAKEAGIAADHIVLRASPVWPCELCTSPVALSVEVPALKVCA